MRNLQSYQDEKRNILSRLFKTLRSRIASLFEPEEVEVTFKVEGNKMSYTYTKISEEQ